MVLFERSEIRQFGYKMVTKKNKKNKKGKWEMWEI